MEAPSPDTFVLSTLATLAAARALGSGGTETVVETSASAPTTDGDKERARA